MKKIRRYLVLEGEKKEAFKYFNDVRCREERQYALFLYNELFSNQDIQNKCLNPDYNPDSEDNKKEYVIIDVYYEFAYMRDKFSSLEKKEINEDRITFNKKLLEYCSSQLNISVDMDEIKEVIGEDRFHYNLGRISINTISKNDHKKVIHMARCMMNAKLDILVVYRENGKTVIHIKSLECKYESGEDKYGCPEFTQTYIQYNICNFIKNNEKIIVDGNIIAEETKYEVEKSEIVYFKKKNQPEYRYVSAEDLTTFHKEHIGKVQE